MDHSTQTHSRRQTLKFFAGAALAAVPALRVINEAAAGRNWCRLDPTSWSTALSAMSTSPGELDATYDTTGPIQMLFRVPTNCRVDLLSSDPGFGHGYDISYDYSPDFKNDHKKIDIEIQVFVPSITDKLPIRVEFVPNTTVEVEDRKDGNTNKWIKVKTRLRKPEETGNKKKPAKPTKRRPKRPRRLPRRPPRNRRRPGLRRRAVIRVHRLPRRPQNPT